MKCVIIGGGISGLYLGWQLQRKGIECVIYEAKKLLGGRVKTRMFQGSRIELGAGKLLATHKKAIKLIKDLGFDMQNDIVRFKRGCDKRIVDIVEKLKGESRRDIVKYTLEGWMRANYNDAFVDSVISSSGYAHLFKYCNAYDGMKYLERDFLEGSEVVSFQPGLSAIIDRLERAFLAAGGRLVKGKAVKDVKKDIDININYSGGDCLVLAVPPGALKGIKGLPDDVYDLCDKVTGVPLMRIYGRIGNAYRDVLPFTVATNGNKIQRIVGVDGKAIQYSYSSDDNALFWRDVIKKKSFWEEYVKQIKDFVPHVNGLKKPVETTSCFWDAGVHLWKQGNNGEKVWKRVLNRGDNVFVVGEAFAPYQRWIESALITADAVASKIKAIASGKESHLRKTGK